jgi:diguanylate cyclase (GGDEF)-like protein/PAS domain S-box-containing protein
VLQDASNFKPDTVRLLHLEDNPVDAELILRQLTNDGLQFACTTVKDEHSFRRAIVDLAPQVILSDFSLPGFDGLSALRIASEMAPGTPFVFVSGTIGEERAIEALRSGAVDYVLKDNLRRLVPAIRGAMRQLDATKARDLAEEMLRRSESRLQDIVNTSRDWIWECDREGRFTFSSPSIKDILGYGHHEVLGRRCTDYVEPDDSVDLRATFAELDSGDDTNRTVTLRWLHKNGKVRWLERKWVALRDDMGALRGMRGIDRDVTVRRIQEVRIRRLNRALRFLSGASSAVMRLRDRAQLVKEACRLAVRVGGYMRATIHLLPAGGAGGKAVTCSYAALQDEGAQWSAGVSVPEGATAVRQALATSESVILADLEDASSTGGRLPEYEALLAIGVRAYMVLPLIIDGTAIGAIELHSDEAGVFGEAELALLKQVAANITFSLQYLHSKESAEYLVYFDPLTALANRSLFVQRLANAVQDAAVNSRGVALLTLDIARLGLINDSLGHHAGDLLLQLVADRLKNTFRDTSALCRLGGDRFAVMAADASQEGATLLQEKVAFAFEAPFAVQEQELRLTIVAGLAQWPDDGTEPEALLQHAQTALDHAKQSGERYLRHQPTMTTSASARLSLTNELRRAVEGRRFELHYQPKIATITGQVTGVEALLRWPESATGVSPSVFVPMLESLGLIHELGSWAIVQALAQTADWLTSSPEFRVAVNISPLQLDRDDFADRLLELVGDPRNAHRLELEVTESTLMRDPRKARASLERLRAAGLTVAIDDFGTGHSSLRVLAGLPVDVLKIDRSFVNGIAHDRNHRVIVQTTISLAASLGMSTVAEGVEDEEQVAVLRELGCDCLQGYLIHRPAPAAVVAQWLANKPHAPREPALERSILATHDPRTRSRRH